MVNWWKMNKKITILIADDEKLARKRIVKLLGEIDAKANLLEASSGKEAITLIGNNQPDIIFLDIQMTDMTGFDVLRKINRSLEPVIIFVTAHDVFAVKAFEVQALDFLLKPYKKERFVEAFNRALKQLENKDKEQFKTKLSGLLGYLNNESKIAPQNHYLDKLVLKVNKKYYFVEVNTIKYITSSAYYAEIFTFDGKKHIYRISMTDFMNKLDPDLFIRVNRSAILNLSQIKEVISEGAGDFSVVMHDEASFALTKIYKNGFLQKVQIKNT